MKSLRIIALLCNLTALVFIQNSYADQMALALPPAAGNAPAATTPAAVPLTTNNGAASTPTNNVDPAIALKQLYADYFIPSAPDIDATSYILIDASSGNVIAEKDADIHHPPASLTKLMTIYITFKDLASGRLQLDTLVPISDDAWRTGGSRMFIKPGSQISVQDLIQGVVVVSGNDASTALSQFIGGTEDAFVQIMNQQASALGMANTHFMDATGLPNPDHFSTARDLGTLARAIVSDYPQYYHFFGEKWFTYNGIKQPNRVSLLWRDEGVDGMKTGHTDAAGYCLIASALQNNTRLIAVVLGTPSEAARNNDAQALLRYGFHFFTTTKLYDANQAIAQVRVYGGENKYVSIGAEKPLNVTIPTNAYKDMKASMDAPKSVKAPVQKGQVLGQVTITIKDKVIMTTPLVALQDDAKGGMFRRLTDWIAAIF